MFPFPPSSYPEPPKEFIWLLNRLTESTQKLLSKTPADYGGRYSPSSTVVPAGASVQTASVKKSPVPPPPPPKPKVAVTPTPTPTSSKNPPVTSVEYPMMMNVPVSMKPQGKYKGGQSTTDIAWRNYWNAQAQKQNVYQSGVAPSQLPPPTAQYSDLSVAQRQMFRKKRSEGASWEQALNAARSNR